MSMTREEWIHAIKCSTFFDERGRKELIALIESAGLTETELSNLCEIYQRLSDKEEVGPGGMAALKSIIASNTPAPAVEWTDRGCYSIANVGEWSLSVWPSSTVNKDYAWSVAHGDGFDGQEDFGDTGCPTRSDAKRAAQQRLAELIREGGTP